MIKTVLEDDVLPSGIPVPRGSNIIFLPYAFGRSSKIWKEPLTFRPERWLEGTNPTQYEYPAFNCGPRICLGKTLAEIQGVFVLVSLLRQYEFKIDPNQEIVPGVSLQLGLLCKRKCRASKEHVYHCSNIVRLY